MAKTSLYSIYFFSVSILLNCSHGTSTSTSIGTLSSPTSFLRNSSNNNKNSDNNEDQKSDDKFLLSSSSSSCKKSCTYGDIDSLQVCFTDDDKYAEFHDIFMREQEEEEGYHSSLLLDWTCRYHQEKENQSAELEVSSSDVYDSEGGEEVDDSDSNESKQEQEGNDKSNPLLEDCLMSGVTEKTCGSGFLESACVWCSEPVLGLCVTPPVSMSIGRMPIFNCGHVEKQVDTMSSSELDVKHEIVREE
eukprot:CAMPEP_0178960228 /NCGR_PEP_ID=MMETSP0789-20121207/12837_1 /TAXON_ID=3005 /ORGANISM="Rhizosolenia setigera, Strain CCMP 1694" /LENGTH=246 /DNA_ID=CAMNT_0020643533 /DNA_START=56 /DNA_END=796 /DNA_ORIENTATION=-